MSEPKNQEFTRRKIILVTAMIAVILALCILYRFLFASALGESQVKNPGGNEIETPGEGETPSPEPPPRDKQYREAPIDADTANAEFLFLQHLGGFSEDTLHCVLQTAGSRYLIGETESDSVDFRAVSRNLFIAKQSRSGEITALTTLNELYHTSFAAAVLHKNGIVILGYLFDITPVLLFVDAELRTLKTKSLTPDCDYQLYFSTQTNETYLIENGDRLSVSSLDETLHKTPVSSTPSTADLQITAVFDSPSRDGLDLFVRLKDGYGVYRTSNSQIVSLSQDATLIEVIQYHSHETKKLQYAMLEAQQAHLSYRLFDQNFDPIFVGALGEGTDGNLFEMSNSILIFVYTQSGVFAKVICHCGELLKEENHAFNSTREIYQSVRHAEGLLLLSSDLSGNINLLLYRNMEVWKLDMPEIGRIRPKFASIESGALTLCFDTENSSGLYQDNFGEKDLYVLSFLLNFEGVRI